MSKKSVFLPLPKIGLGTYLIDHEKAIDIFKMAYDLGYRHFDTAAFYNNEHYLGKALAAFERCSYLITTKLWMDDMGYYQAIQALDRSLNELKTSYIDYYLIHWPYPQNKISESLVALHECQLKGRIRHYGVSNFTIGHLKDVQKEGFSPSVNQVEYHPFLNQERLLQYCQGEAIQLIAYSPLARTKALNHPILLKLAKQYQKSSAQVILRWLMQKGIVVIPKASSLQHLKENLDILDFKLSSVEMGQINRIEYTERLVTPDCGDFAYGEKKYP